MGIPIKTFGLWVDETTEAADNRALAGSEPDAILRVDGHLSASHLIAWGNAVFPERHVVREVEAKTTCGSRFVAVQAV
jgi:hypothetical protein